jgi:hypothetical protein
MTGVARGTRRRGFRQSFPSFSKHFQAFPSFSKLFPSFFQTFPKFFFGRFVRFQALIGEKGGNRRLSIFAAFPSNCPSPGGDCGWMVDKEG